MRSGEVGHEEREDLSLGAAEHRADTVRAVERALERASPRARGPGPGRGTTSCVAKEATQCGGISCRPLVVDLGEPVGRVAVARVGRRPAWPPGSVSSVNSWPKTPSWKFCTAS